MIDRVKSFAQIEKHNPIYLIVFDDQVKVCIFIVVSYVICIQG